MFERCSFTVDGKERSVVKGPDMGSQLTESTVSITVVGASGDLAKKKIFPALFALFYEDYLPKVLFSILILLKLSDGLLKSLNPLMTYYQK